jgi:hypothetical protein
MAARRDPHADDTAHLPPPSPHRGWRRLDALASIGFVIALCVPLVLFVAGQRPPLIDNRPLLTPPPITPASLLDTSMYTALDRYLADIVAVRSYAVTIRSAIDAGVLGGTVTTEVVRGTGDWMFSIAELEPTCRTAVFEVTAALERLQTDFAAAGQEFRFLVVPDKRVIYPGRLRTDLALPTPCTDIRRQPLRDWLAQHAAFAVDGWTPLLAARGAEGTAETLYYPQDSHWTPAGAIVAMRDLVRSLDPALWDDAQVVQDGLLERPQELARQMGIANTISVPRLRVRPGSSLDRTELETSVELVGAAAVYRYTAGGSLPVLPGRTVIVYDSFFGITQSLLAPFFAESIWIHSSDLGRFPELAGELGPFDRVIFERVERGLYATDIEQVLRPLVRAAS